MESQPQNPEFRIILKTFTHALQILFIWSIVLRICCMELLLMVLNVMPPMSTRFVFCLGYASYFFSALTLSLLVGNFCVLLITFANSLDSDQD